MHLTIQRHGERFFLVQSNRCNQLRIKDDCQVQFMMPATDKYSKIRVMFHQFIEREFLLAKGDVSVVGSQ